MNLKPEDSNLKPVEVDHDNAYYKILIIHRWDMLGKSHREISLEESPDINIMSFKSRVEHAEFMTAGYENT